MKVLTCKVNNLNHALLGKVTFSSKILKRGDYFLVKRDANRSKHGYVATLSSSPELERSLSQVQVPIDFKLNENGQSLKKGEISHKVKPQKQTGIKTQFDSSFVIYCSEDTLNQLKEGDVVQVEPDGRFTVLIEAQSNANFLALTERCNHRCIMCPQPPVTHEESRLEHNLRLIELMPKDTQSLCITGGEPTMLGDELIMVLKRLKNHSPNTAITILTNAVKLADRNFVLKIAACQCSDLQIDVPLFGATPERHNQIVGAKTFYKTVQGLYNLASCRLQVGIRVVMHKLTYQHLSDIAYFIYHNFPFVNQVAFMQMETIGYAQDNIKQLWIDPYDYKDELSNAVNFLRERKINVLIFNAQLCVLNPDVRDIAVQSISDWKNIDLQDCVQCTKRSQCAGFFASNAEYHSSHIAPFTK